MPTTLLRAPPPLWISRPSYSPEMVSCFPRVFLSILIIRPPFDSQLSHPTKYKGQRSKSISILILCTGSLLMYQAMTRKRLVRYHHSIASHRSS